MPDPVPDLPALVALLPKVLVYQQLAEVAGAVRSQIRPALAQMREVTRRAAALAPDPDATFEALADAVTDLLDATLVALDDRWTALESAHAVLLPTVFPNPLP